MDMKNTCGEFAMIIDRPLPNKRCSGMQMVTFCKSLILYQNRNNKAIMISELCFKGLGRFS